MKASKLISLTLAAASVISLTACGGKGKTPPSSGSPPSEENVSSAQSDGNAPPESTSESLSSVPDSVPQSGAGNNGNDGASTVTSNDTSQVTSLPPISGSGVIAGAELILDSGRSIMLSSTGSANGASYAATVNRYKEKFPNINMYSLVIPTAISYYLPVEFASHDPDERGHINEINAALKGVTPVDVYSVLARHTDEPIYFNTDHHWTQLGAFYGAEEFAKTAGVDFKPLSEYDRYDGGDFVGSAYGNSGDDPRVLELVEPFIYYVPKSDFTTTFYELDGSGGTPFKYFEDPGEFDKFGKYSLYMYGDGHIVHMNTSCKNGRRLLVLKEAFANPFCGCLVNSFEDIWVADMKYIKTTATQLINDHDITDLLFCLSTFSTSGANQEFLSEIM